MGHVPCRQRPAPSFPPYSQHLGQVDHLPVSRLLVFMEWAQAHRTLCMSVSAHRAGVSLENPLIEEEDTV